MTELKNMKAELAGLECQLKALQCEIAPLRQAILEAEAKFKVGDQITWKKGKSLSRGRVVAILSKFSAYTEYRAIPTLKSGADGAPVKLVDWGYDGMAIDPEAV
jgi:hypothetical protein